MFEEEYSRVNALEAQSEEHMRLFDDRILSYEDRMKHLDAARACIVEAKGILADARMQLDAMIQHNEENNG